MFQVMIDSPIGPIMFKVMIGSPKGPIMFQVMIQQIEIKIHPAYDVIMCFVLSLLSL